MNTTTDLADLPAADRAFAVMARQGLRASETLDYVESARLAAGRQRALAAMLEPTRRPGWLLAPAGAALALALLIAVLPSRLAVTPGLPAPAQVNANEVAALEWAADEAGPEFYRDLEFYQWLEQHGKLESPPEPNA